MVEESPEVRAAVLGWFEADNQADWATQRAMYSSSAATTFIGSDLEEWWVGEEVSSVISEAKELAGTSMVNKVEKIEAYREGNVGWAAVLSRVRFEHAEPRWFRDTFVLRLEAGTWKILQSHSSVAVPNSEVVGIELTTTLDELLAALGDEAGRELTRSMSDGSVTVMFTDIEDSSAEAQRIGDQPWADYISWHDRTIRQIVEAHGGVLVKSLGDGAMTVFNAAHSAAGAAFEIQHAMSRRVEPPTLRIRIGMHVGEAIDTGSDYLGNTVNKAARITAAADGGDVLVSSSVRESLEGSGDFTFGDNSSVRLKGLDGVHEVCRLLPSERPPADGSPNT